MSTSGDDTEIGGNIWKRCGSGRGQIWGIIWGSVTVVGSGLNPAAADNGQISSFSSFLLLLYLLVTFGKKPRLPQYSDQDMHWTIAGSKRSRNKRLSLLRKVQTGPELTKPLLYSVQLKSGLYFNHLNAELNPVCHLLALLEAHHILHVSRIRGNMSNLFTKIYNMLYYTTNLYLQ